MDRLEILIEREVTKWAEEQGFYARKLMFISQRGAPDRLYITPNGDILFVEFKRRTGKLSPSQREFRTLARKRGLKHYVFRDYEQSIEELKKFL